MIISHADDNLKHKIHYNQMLGALTLNSSSTSPHQRQNGQWQEKLKWRWPTHGVPVNTTQEKFRGGYYIIPQILPAHPRATNPMLFTVPYFHTRPPPALCFLSFPHHPVKHLSCQSYTLPSAGFMSLGISSMLQSMNRCHEPLPDRKPSYHPSTALQHLPL